MKKKTVLLLVSLICVIALVACTGRSGGEQGDASDTTPLATDTGDATQDTGHDTGADTTPVTVEISISDNEIGLYRLVVPSGDEVANVIAEQVAQVIRDAAGVTLPIVTDAETAGDHEIRIGRTNRMEAPGLGADTFKVLESSGNLYVWYTDSQFSCAAIINAAKQALVDVDAGKIAIPAGYEVTAKISDYMYGDSEFNPFE